MNRIPENYFCQSHNCSDQDDLQYPRCKIDRPIDWPASCPKSTRGSYILDHLSKQYDKIEDYTPCCLRHNKDYAIFTWLEFAKYCQKVVGKDRLSKEGFVLIGFDGAPLETGQCIITEMRCCRLMCPVWKKLKEKT